MNPMRVVIYGLFFVTAALLTGCSGCTEQYDTQPHSDAVNKERVGANEAVPVLDEGGTIPVAAAEDSAAANPVMAKYTTFCASCHGAEGMGDGAAAAGLNPKPRNLHDKQWHASVDDNHIYKVIKEGGPSVGLSASMAPWGAVLSDDEINAMVAIIRDWGK